MGVEIDGRVHTDSSAALGITSRKGLGKLRHVRVQTLWVQDKLREKQFLLAKVLGEDNVADLFTKNLDASTMTKHMLGLGFMIASGRAAGAPSLVNMILEHSGLSQDQPVAGEPAVGTRGPAWAARDVSPSGIGLAQQLDDQWVQEDGSCTRVHVRPRTCLFTPLRVEGAPPAKALCNTRITEGTYCDNNEAFSIVDSWTARAVAHRPLARPWVGSTRFIRIGDTAPNFQVSQVTAAARTPAPAGFCDSAEGEFGKFLSPGSTFGPDASEVFVDVSNRVSSVYKNCSCMGLSCALSAG